MTPPPSTRSVPSELVPRVDNPESIIRQSNTTSLCFHHRNVEEASRYDTSETLVFANVPSRPIPASAKPYVAQGSISPIKSTPIPGAFPSSPLSTRSPLGRIKHEEDHLQQDLNARSFPSSSQVSRMDAPGTMGNSSTDELLRAMLVAQTAGIRAANEAAERQAKLEEERIVLAREADERLAGLEERLLAFQLNQPSQQHTSIPEESESRGLDLTKFKSSDGPQFKGPYRDTEAFLRWSTSLKIFFLVKKIEKDMDRIILTGSYLLETNLQSFWAHNIENFKSLSWNQFKEKLFRAALPSDWNDKLREKIITLRMTSNEDFKFYCTRARSLQSLMNHDCVEIDDFTLATHMMLGMVPELKSSLRLEGLLKKENFDSIRFEEWCDIIYEDLVVKKIIIK